MRIERLDAATLDRATAEQLATVARAELSLDMPNEFPPSGEGLQLELRHGHDDMPAEGLWLARADDGELLGYGRLTPSRWDNPRLAFVFCSVAPAARGRGAGTLLLAAQVDAARALGRTSLLTFTTPDGHAAGFLGAHGFTTQQATAQRRLQLHLLDGALFEKLAAQAAEKAGDYELLRLVGPPPDELLPGMALLHEAINDAPMDAIDYEREEYPVERVRRYAAAMAARRQVVYRIAARHRRTGDWAGHTILCVDQTRPGYAVQEDTSVRAQHRGHRLGMLLKASMLLWMRDEHPELTTIDTWNASSNTHMIAINEALGCQVSALGVAMQRNL